MHFLESNLDINMFRSFELEITFKYQSLVNKNVNKDLGTDVLTRALFKI